MRPVRSSNSSETLVGQFAEPLLGCLITSLGVSHFALFQGQLVTNVFARDQVQAIKPVALGSEPDLAQDTRVPVPIYVDPFKGTMRLWVTLGVRLTKLDARFVRAPRLKPAEGEGYWKEVEGWKLHTASHLIAVDEFAEVEVPTLSPPNREELRKLCDQHRAKEKIVEALAAGKS